MTLVILLGVIAVVALGTWLIDKVVDGFADRALLILAWPFRTLWRHAELNRTAHALRCPHTFRSSLDLEAAGQIIAELPGVADAPAPGPLVPHYRHREPGHAVVAVGSDAHTLHEAGIHIRADPGCGGTVGDISTRVWQGDIDAALRAHHDLLDTAFPALHAANAQLSVATIAPQSSASASGTRTTNSRLAKPAAVPWPRHRQIAGTVVPHLPAIPTAALALFTIAVLVAIVVGSGTFRTTSKDELCESYNAALTVFNDDSTFDATDELNDLADKAKHYDGGDVEEDGKDIADLGGMVSSSELAQSSRHIAETCSGA